ncbi:hypothetical protein GCM10011514_52670 [Emticicia aquatilis]|uniref:Uncharacterized protein n=1 Tax=Emticicia aquatilis TaxID=1537369 RepID=A0A917DZE3_9BACT|nr:hypothetical protein [Emticicia aquatilis]GGD82077.1 hypothetical protein GCM10011514_52670 [Emticicia aquatilis]
MVKVLSIQNFTDSVSSLLHLKDIDKRALVNPDVIFSTIPENDFIITQIPDWESFEFGIDSWDENNFFDLMFQNIKDTQILLLTDEGLKRQMSFAFNINHFNEFVRWYEGEFDCAFMQPSDYIVIINDCVKVLHHGGVIIETLNKKATS